MADLRRLPTAVPTVGAKTTGVSANHAGNWLIPRLYLA
jgi:hypothetical protein